MFASFRTSWILQGQSALLHCLSLGVCRRWNGCIYRMEKDEQKTMLLVTSFCLLSCLRETHSESTDEGSNSSCGWEKWGVCLPPVHWATWLFRVHVSSSLYWCRAYGELLILCLAFRPVNTFDLSTQLKKTPVYTGVIERRHYIKLNEMRLGYFSLGIYGQFYFQLYSNRKIILLGWSSCQLNNKAIVILGSGVCILFHFHSTVLSVQHPWLHLSVSTVTNKELNSNKQTRRRMRVPVRILS